ncbi:MAG: hypothetical protein WBO29_08005 [Albidovulum sp.]
MKPGFALDLTHDAIRLLQRAPQGWAVVGSVELADPNLGAMLTKLRRMARRLAPDGFATKLVLPETQILYLEVEAQSADRAGRRKTIAAALEGRTPYRPDELVFDWSGTGQRLKVAVVAKVTLDEAEAFAETHRLNPVSFVTRPQDGTFAGEPFFGQTSRADSYLLSGEKLDRDQDPIRIIPAGTETSLGGATPEPDLPETTGETQEPLLETAQESDDEAPAAGALAEPVSAEPTAADDNALSGTFHTRRSADAAGTEDTTESLTEGTAPTVPDADIRPPAPRINLLEAETVHLPEVDFTATDVAAGGLGITADQVPLPQGNAEPEAKAPRDPAKAAGLFGRALLKTLPDPRTIRAGLKPENAPGIPGQTRVDKTDFAVRRPQFLRRVPPVAAGMALLLAVVFMALGLWAIWPGTKATSENDVAAPVSAPVNTVAEAVPPGPAVSSDAPATLPQPTPNDAVNPAQSLGAVDVGQEVASQSAPPALAAIASEDSAPAAALSPEPTVVAETPTTRNVPDISGTDIWTDLPAGISQPAVDATGAPSIAGVVSGPALTEPENLPALAALAPDQNLLPQITPPPFGSIVQYDAQGMVIPTKDGVVTTDGITLIAGSPPRVPAPRPQGLVKAATEATNPLAGKLPKARPEGLAPANVPESVEIPPDATAQDPAAIEDQTDASPMDDPALLVVDPTHAARKPRGRPASVQAQADRALATQTAIDEAAAAAQSGEEAASVLAVETSRRPSTRPSVFAQAVEAAIADAVASPAEDIGTTSTAVEIDEPEPATNMPDIPTTITVAKQATIKNAINLSQVSLIGVYGSSANRRALVRMPNGKFLKVKIGDRLDGGKVAAIGDNEMSYVKSGRTIVLKMSNKG